MLKEISKFNFENESKSTPIESTRTSIWDVELCPPNNPCTLLLPVHCLQPLGVCFVLIRIPRDFLFSFGFETISQHLPVSSLPSMLPVPSFTIEENFLPPWRFFKGSPEPDVSTQLHCNLLIILSIGKPQFPALKKQLQENCHPSPQTINTIPLTANPRRGEGGGGIHPYRLVMFQKWD